MPPDPAPPPGEGELWPEEVVVARHDVDHARSAAARGRRMQKTWYLTKEIIDRTNAAVYWCLPKALAHQEITDDEIDLSRVPDSASALVETALWSEVLRLETMFNAGRPFAPAPGRLRTGPGQQGVNRLSEPRGPRSSRR